MDYKKIIAFAQSAKVDYAHNFDHVLRVYRNAMRIAQGHPEADMEVLRTAVLLHDVGRAGLTVAHAKKGAVIARDWLMQNGCSEAFAEKVARVISAHSDKDEASGAGIEGEILWDADKLEMTGAVGAMRAMLYCEEVGLPIRAASGAEAVMPGPKDLIEQFIEDQGIAARGFHTKEAAAMARERIAFGKQIIEHLREETAEEEII